jgi:DNA polymerase
MTKRKIAAVDFETFYIKGEYSIREMGGYKYTHDPRFDAYMVSIATSEGDQFVGHPKDFDFSCICGGDWEWVSHNARFDFDVYLALHENNPSDYPIPENWYCTSDMAAYFQIPRSLESVVKVVYKRQLKKSVRDNMSGRRVSDLTDYEKEELRKYALADSEECLRFYLDYSERWPDDEKTISVINRTIGQNGVYVDVPYLERAGKHLQGILDKACSKMPWVAKGDKPLSLKAVKEECASLGIEAPKSMAKDSEEFENWLELHGSKYEWALETGKYRSANRLKKVVETMQSRIQPDNTMEIYWLYFGAHTGRFSGSEGFNAQNLPRLPVFGVDLRKAVIPPKGHVIITCDASNIEFRTLMYWAKDEGMLQMLRDGYNPYEAVASMFGGWKGEKGTLKKENPQTYAMFKAIALGCGFGMGGERFRVSAKTLTGGAYTPTLEQATSNVYEFRSAVPSCKRLWDTLQNEIRNASCRETPNLQLKLPSGRRMIYRQIDCNDGEYTALTIRKGQFARTKIYGGLLSENLSQALARDIFVYHMKKVVEAGLQICLHTHDEIVIYSPEETALENQKKIETIMSTPPPWIDLPLGVESEICSHYKK